MEQIFLQTIKDHQRIIHKVSRMYRNSREDQQDLFQEIVFQLWQAFPSFRNESKVSTWIYRIALNTAIAIYRKKNINVIPSESLPDYPNVADDISENEEQMYRALRTLTDPEKALVSLYLEDYSYHEIAEMMGITENYVGVKMNRIKEKLKSILNKKKDEPR